MNTRSEVECVMTSSILPEMRVSCRQFSGRPFSNSLYPDIFLNTPVSVLGEEIIKLSQNFFRHFDFSAQDARGRVVSAHRIVLASLSSTARRMLEEGRVRPRDVMTLR